MEDLNTLYPEPPEEINLSSTVIQVEENQVDKFKIFLKSCQYSLILMGAMQAINTTAAAIYPDVTVYKNLKGMAATDRAYIKQILNNCGGGNFFADNSDSCQIATSALATLFKGEAVIAKIELDKLPQSKHASYEAQAEASMGNEQSPANN